MEKTIRELSTPVLQVREQMFILPIIGVLDSFRARQLTEQLLRVIRYNRAKVVVTGVSPEIAHTLVTLGVDLSKMNAVGDLQGGIEAADKLLGYRITKIESVTGAVIKKKDIK